MSFGIVTINFRRPMVLQLWLASIDRLRAEFGYFPVVVVSDDDRVPCERHSVHHIAMDNRSMTSKWNTGFRWMRDQKVDYVIILGSDDIMSNDYLAKAIEKMNEQPDMVYTRSIYFYSADRDHSGNLYRYTHEYGLGVGRCIRRNVMEEVGWTPYIRNINFGLDGELYRRIKPFVSTQEEIVGAITDVKTKMNMNSIRVWAKKGERCRPALFLFYLSPTERQLLERIKK